jgi:pantoate--beta-alanine ligase
MQHVTLASELRNLSSEWRREGKRVALVPTQGALHSGQAALIRAAVAKADVVVVSIFVNPIQFPASELLKDYPRSLEDDLKLCEACGAHVVFTPDVSEIYPPGFSTFVSEEALSKPLDGISRPQHFRGVATLMARLFNLVRPGSVFMGQKAAQRVAVVRKMIADLAWDIAIEVVPTVRESDGLAAGVPNRHFTASQRQDALSIPRSLERAKEMCDSGVRSADRIAAEVTHILGEHRRIRVIYVGVVDPVTMETQREIVPGSSLLVIGAWVDEVRLIDNVEL